MNRTGLTIALAIAAVVGIAFGFAPDLDLKLSRPFFAIARDDYHFGLRFHPTVRALRDAGIWLIVALAAPAFAALLLKLVLPRRRLLMSGRAIIFLITTLALAPGLLANLTLKEYWDRPRPVDVVAFDGPDKHVAWWDPRGACPTNCSFVSGDVSGAFWSLAPAALAPPQWRALAYGGALAFGAAMALLRLIAGAHFFTDVAFAGLFTFLIVWIAHGAIFRWSHTRMTDEGVERAIERVALPPHDLLCGLFRRRPRQLDP
jgi:membrane-associated PAP2 superfamily phosphatase